MGRDRVIIARIGAPHGVRGDVRLMSYAGVPADVAAYGPLTATDGRRFEIARLRPAGARGRGGPDVFVAHLRGVDDRDQAARLNGLELSVSRDRLPPAEDGAYYHADLIGVEAVGSDGTALGTVTAVVNYGAGDLIEVADRQGRSVLVPFTRAIVPEVDLAAGRLTVDPPPGLFGDGGPEDEAT